MILDIYSGFIHYSARVTADFPTASLVSGQPEDPKDLAARPPAMTLAEH
jgi:hypothetical protein